MHKSDQTFINVKKHVKNWIQIHVVLVPTTHTNREPWIPLNFRHPDLGILDSTVKTRTFSENKNFPRKSRQLEENNGRRCEQRRGGGGREKERDYKLRKWKKK